MSKTKSLPSKDLRNKSWEGIALILGVLVMSIFVGYLVLAWTEPSSAPPGGNVPAPVNVGTSGQIKYGSLGIGANNAFYADPPTFVVDAVNHRVGIGTISPNEKLEVASTTGGRFIVSDGGGANRRVILMNAPTAAADFGEIFAYKYGAGAGGRDLILNYYGGNVGIGTISPSGVLHIRRDVYGPKLILDDPNTANKVPLEFRANNIIKWELGQRPVGEDYDLGLWRYDGVAYHSVMWWEQNTGNVGIGTTGPFRKLHVAEDRTGVGDGQMVVGGLTNTNKQLIFGYDTTNNVGQIQAIIQGTGVSPLALQPAGGNVGIGTTSPDPSAKLEVAGQIKITGGSPGADKVLTSDAAGLASWQPPAVLSESDTLQTVTTRGATTNLTITTAGLILNGSGNEGNISAINQLIGYNDLYLKSNSGETTPIYYGASEHRFYTANTEKLTILNNGNVGIGTTNPTRPLQLDVAGVTRFYVTTGGQIFGGTIYAATSGNNYFRGNVGIGTTGPNAQLEIAESVNGGRLIVSDGGGANRSVILMDAPSAAADYGEIAAYKYGTGAGGRNLIINYDGGNVGIGTISPSGVLHIRRDVYGPKLILDDPNTANKVPLEFRANNAVKWELGQRPSGEDYDLGLWRYYGANYYPVMWWEQNTGNVGIGLTSPDPNYKLTISEGGIKAESSSQPAGYFSSTSGYGLLVNGGNVGIGTLTPGEKLDVAGGGIHATGDICTDQNGYVCLSSYADMWRTISFDDFDSPPSGWYKSSGGGIVTTFTCSKTLEGQSFFQTILGKYANDDNNAATNTCVAKTFTNLPSHSIVRVVAYYYAGGLWAWSTGYIKIDGEVVYFENSFHTRNDLGFCDGSTLRRDYWDIKKPHNGATLIVEFCSDLTNVLNPGWNQSPYFGIDNVEISVQN